MVAYEWVLGVALGVAVLIGVLLMYQEEVRKESAESHQSLIRWIIFSICFFVADYLTRISLPGELLFFLVMLVCTYVIIRSVLRLVVMFVLQLFRHDLYGIDVWTFSTRVVYECVRIGVCLIAVFEILWRV